MMPMTAGQVHENLVDAGCSADVISQFEQLAVIGRQRELRRLLDRHRQTLLNSIHEGQKKLDCLDYLIYCMDEQATMAR